MIRVVVADDHAVVRSGLAQLLRAAPDVEFVNAYPDGAAVVDAVLADRPDVVLMDLSMPELDGVEATRRIGETFPHAQVVVLTSFSDGERIVAAIDAGAAGYLLKDADPEQLLDGIRAAARGESPLSPKAARLLLDSRRRASEPELSARERDVLALVAAGASNKVVAQRLGIAEKTVKAHLTSIYRTIGVYDRFQAALWARERGITT